MWLTSNGEQKGAYSLIPFNRLSGNFVYRMGSDVYDPLRILVNRIILHKELWRNPREHIWSFIYFVDEINLNLNAREV